MRRRGRLAGIALALVAGLCAAAYPARSAPAPTVSETYTNPVFDMDFPDPFVLPTRGAYYAYATNSTVNVQVISSNNLRNWTLHREALPLLPGWAEGGHTWAPSVVETGGRYVLYFAARHRAARVPCIGAAHSASPTGPFVNVSGAPLMCQPDRGGSIDPSVYRDGDGALWLLWKSEGHRRGEPTRLWSQRLTADGTTLTGRANFLAQRDQGWEVEIIENPSMVRLGGKLFLFFSGARWQDASYAIGYAQCDTPAGPCRKAPSPIVTSNGAVHGPGGQEFFSALDGTVWMAYHGWRPGRTGYPVHPRLLRLDKVALVNGRPFVSGPTAHSVSVAGSPDRPAVAISGLRSGTGYRVVADDGDVFAFGTASHSGRANGPTVAAANTPSGHGYWTASPGGKVTAFGDALRVPTTIAPLFRSPVTAMAATPSGAGYWLVTAGGEVFGAGDARWHGAVTQRLAAPVVGIAPTTTGRGYWLAAADGGVFAFGDAAYAGSAVGLGRSAVTGIAAHPLGHGYWLASEDGGVFAFGTARFLGAAADRRPRRIVDITAAATGKGYWLLGANGAVYSFGDAVFHGSSPMPD